MCLVSLPLAAIEIWPSVRGAIDRPVGRVLVEGDFRFVDQTRVADLVMAELADQGEAGNFFALDLQRLQLHLQRDVWIDVAQIGRRWPDILTVRVQEHKPIARWGEKGFLNLRGDVIDAALKPELLTLPLLEGELGQEQAVMVQYQRLSSLLHSRALEIARLQLSTTGLWQMQLTHIDGQIQVIIGRDQIMEKMQRFLLVFDAKLHSQRARIAKIDLRYSNGVAVSWRESTDNIVNS